jgi:hypothetical protein
LADWLSIAFPYIIAFIAGFAVKIVDWIDDEEGGKIPVKWPAAVFYGLMIGYLISEASFSVLFLAAVLSQVFATKIDTKAHAIGLASTAIVLLFLGIPEVDFGIFAFFIVLAFLDEVEWIGWLRPLENYRLILKAGALAMIFIGRWDFFIAIMVFDIGYMLSEKLAEKGFYQSPLKA